MSIKNNVVVAEDNNDNKKLVWNVRYAALLLSTFCCHVTQIQFSNDTKLYTFLLKLFEQLQNWILAHKVWFWILFILQPSQANECKLAPFFNPFKISH